MNLSNLKRINIVDLPDEVFLNGSQIVEIMRAKILTRSEKSANGRGTPDIRLHSYSGANTFITRNELTNNFLGVNNKKIVLGGWRNGKEYIVFRQLNTNVSIVHCPKYAKYLLVMPNNKLLKSGYYFVCRRNETGKLLKESGIQVGPTLFKKMFVINDNADKLRERSKTISVKDAAVNDSKSSVNSAINKVENTTKSVITNRLKSTEAQIKINANAKLSVVAKILNSKNQVIGYVISNGEIEKPFERNKVIEMCRKRQVRNMSLVEKDGTEFLRGIGITHESLPTKYM